MVKGKHILLGITGGIAAYKSAELASRLRKQGAEISVVMTQSATEFISPLTLRSISSGPVYVDMFEEPKTWNIEHISLAEKTDAVIVAPASANTLAKMALGIADNFLTTVLLAVKVPVFVVPAMNHAMYHHPATQDNLKILINRGVHIIGPDTGFQACGTEGEGRMSEPSEIMEEINRFFCRNGMMKGYRVLVTAGGTRELLDPVRYLGNLSSGKMGYAIAQAFIEAGAEVTLISAPTGLPLPQGVTGVNVVSAREMEQEVLGIFDEQDIVIKAAAVADYRPASYKEQKIKKNGQELIMELVPNPDILQALGKRKNHQFIVGFAAETENIIENGLEKMRKKNTDMLVVNDVTAPGAGFGEDTNIVSFLFPDGEKVDLPKMSKLAIARQLVEVIAAIKKETDHKE